MEKESIVTYRKTHTRDIGIDQLIPGRYQPRRDFTQDGLASLAQTMREVGILEPLVVRPVLSQLDQYEIVAGERRWRAAQLVGFATVPCVICSYTDEQAAQVALIENMCREALNPIAEAQAMQRIIDEFGYTQEELATVLGVHRLNVTHHLRLLKLDSRIQTWLAQGMLTQAHGKLLAGVAIDKQYALAYQAIQKAWSVRTLEKAIHSLKPQKPVAKPPSASTIHTAYLERQLSEQLGYPTKLHYHINHSGHLRIDFTDLNHLQGLLEKLGYREP